MLSRRVLAVLRREIRDLARIAPLIAFAVVLALWFGPSLVSFAADHFQSPVSPVSPTLRPPTVPAPASHLTQPATAAPELPTAPPPEPTEAPPPPPSPPVVAQPVVGTPPTLWIVLGLLVVGVVVVALVFLRRPGP